MHEENFLFLISRQNSRSWSSHGMLSLAMIETGWKRCAGLASACLPYDYQGYGTTAEAAEPSKDSTRMRNACLDIIWWPPDNRAPAPFRHFWTLRWLRPSGHLAAGRPARADST